MTELTIKVELELEESVVSDLLCCAFEGGIGYWARIGEHSGVNASLVEMVLAADGWVLLEDASGRGFPEDGSGHKDRKLDRATAIKGLGVVAAKHPHHFAHVIDPSLMDSTTGDVFAQCAIFGAVIFG